MGRTWVDRFRSAIKQGVRKLKMNLVTDAAVVTLREDGTCWSADILLLARA
jgi:hypothetical protein